MRQTINTLQDERERQTEYLQAMHGQFRPDPISVDELIADLQLRVQALEDFLAIK